MLCEGFAALAAPERPAVVVLARQGATQRDGAAELCVPSYARPDAAGDRLVENARAQGVALVHFQHAPDIFGMGRWFLERLRRLRDAGVRVVVTLHTVFTRASGLLERQPFSQEFYCALGRVCDAVIIHHDRPMRATLRRAGVADERIVTIPHGTLEPRAGEPEHGRAIIGAAPADEVVLSFGFLHLQKNVQVVIRALAELRRARPRARLFVVGQLAGPTWYNRAYRVGLDALVRWHRLGDRVVFVDRFVDDEHVPDVFAAARVVVLPHAQGYGSASGVVHLTLAMRRALLCSRSAKFAEVADAISPRLLVPTGSPRAWARALEDLLADDAGRAALCERIAGYGARTSWPRVAAAHVDLYRRLLRP
jgi:glycosyltransferase involved in cell wall biosynthesis